MLTPNVIVNASWLRHVTSMPGMVWGVSRATLAREAGVGKATLSRRFAPREQLISAVFADRMDGYAAATSRALAEPDAWQGFIGFIEEVCAMQVIGLLDGGRQQVLDAGGEPGDLCVEGVNLVEQHPGQLGVMIVETGR